MRAVVAASRALSIFALVFLAGFTRGGLVGPPLPPSAFINVATLSAGTQTANSLSPTCFSNPTDTVFSNTTWTPLSTQYLAASGGAQLFLARSKQPCDTRDVEVTTWARDGYVYLRLDTSGNAIYFHHNGETTNGTLDIGVVTGLDESTYPGGTYYSLYQNANLVGTISGYNKTDTTGATFTFGVSGFNIYAKFNGIQIAAFQSYYQMSVGAVALKANTGYGFRAITFTPEPYQFLYSQYGIASYDPRDFGLKAGQTTGTISGSSNSLVLASSIGSAVGDSVIVAVGGESGAGARGTVGVGGNNPSLSFANATAMNADTTEPDGTYAWTTNDGNAFVSFSGTWAQSADYYLKKVAPRALIAGVTAVSPDGKTLTLDTSATTTATNANVYLNGYSAFNAILNPATALPTLPNVTMSIPAGTYAVGAPMAAPLSSLNLSLKTGWKVLGQGIANTTLMSPAGTTSMGGVYSQSTNTEVSNIAFVGNNGANGFGVVWNGNSFVSYPRAINFQGNSDNSVAHDFTTTNIFYSGVSSSFSNNVTAYNCTITQSFAPTSGEIEPWYIEWADSTGGGAHDCTVSSPTMVTALEMFRSSAVKYQRITLNNGAFACNACGGGWLLEDLTINVGVNVAGSFTVLGPLIDVNSNIHPPNPDINLGGTVNRPTVIQQGLYDGANVIPAMAINVDNPNITVTGNYGPNANGKGCFQAPNWASPMDPAAGSAIRNDATGSTISGIRIIGTADTGAGRSNIYNEGGGLTSTGNIMDSATVGAGSTTESGRESNATWNAANPGHSSC